MLCGGAAEAEFKRDVGRPKPVVAMEGERCLKQRDKSQMRAVLFVRVRPEGL
jgi:hypothetical protein